MGLLHQIAAISSVLFTVLSRAIIIILPLMALHDISPPDDDELVSYDQNHQIIYIIHHGAQILGLILSAILMNYFGRKITHQSFSLTGIISLLITRFASDITVLKLSTFIGGLSAGGSISLGPVIIGEYSTPKYRGVFLYSINLALAVGSMYIALITPTLHYRSVIWIGIIQLALGFLIIQLAPESPMWLALKQRYAESEESFRILRGEDDASEKEIKELIEAARHVSKDEELSLCQKMRLFFVKFNKAEIWKPCGIVLTAFTLSIVSSFFPNYFLEVVAVLSYPEQSKVLYVNIFIFVAAITGVILKNYFKQKTIVIITGTIICAFITLFFTFKHFLSFQPQDLFHVICIYCFLTTINFSVFYFVLIGEILPLEHKSTCSVVIGILSHLIMVSWEKLVRLILVNVLVECLAFISLLMIITCLIILYRYLPETKYLTLQEVQKYYVKQNIRNVTVGFDDELDEEAEL